MGQQEPVNPSLPDEVEALRSRVAELERAAAERQRNEEALRAQQTVLRRILANLPLSVFWKDRQGVFLGCNEQTARDLGLPGPEDVVGKTDYDTACVRTEAEFFRQCDREVIESGRARVNFEETQRRRDGSQALLLTSKVPLRDDTGEVIGVLGVYADITEQRRVQHELGQAQKLEAIGRLAGGVAHEFNNLLTTIGGHGELLLHALRPSDPLAEHVREIHRAVDRAAVLTRQMLAFARSEPVAPITQDLNAVVGGLEKPLAQLLGADVTLSTQLAADLWPVCMAGGRLEQVLLTLGVNAQAAMPRGGRFTIATRNVEGQGATGSTRQVLLTVGDTGHGIDPVARARLFEPFFTTRGLGQGTGLGLATVYATVKQAGGRIEVESALGKGTTFHIYLPAVEKVVIERAELPVAGPGRGGETVLVVEDEDALRGLARRILAMHAYVVLEARHGVEALAVAAGHAGPIHLLLTDVVMPQMGGRELVAQLKPQRPGLRVLYMSGYTDGALVREGETDLLAKPFSPDALSRKVREVLDR
jgi:two-component system cell cycle sensor histidine kinase/response regulator CckA